MERRRSSWRRGCAFISAVSAVVSDLIIAFAVFCQRIRHLKTTVAVVFRNGFLPAARVRTGNKPLHPIQHILINRIAFPCQLVCIFLRPLHIARVQTLPEGDFVIFMNIVIYEGYDNQAKEKKDHTSRRNERYLQPLLHLAAGTSALCLQLRRHPFRCFRCKLRTGFRFGNMRFSIPGGLFLFVAPGKRSAFQVASRRPTSISDMPR